MKITLNKDIHSSSPEDTRAIGGWLGQRLESGNVISLIGDLGAGKTVFVKGLAAGMGFENSEEHVVSPTFVVIKEYPMKLPLFHADLYRLDSLSPEDTGEIQEYMRSNGVLAVEWGDKFEELLPKDYLQIKINYLSNSKRKLRMTPKGGFRLRKK